MLVKNLHASMLRFISEFGAEYSMTPVNMDAHADESTLPAGDLISMSSLAWNVDDGILSVEVMFGVSTEDDTNLFRMIDKIAPLYERLLPTMRIDAYDAETGEKVGNFVIRNGTRALPVGGSSSRPLQYIMVGLLSTTLFEPVVESD